MRVVILAISGLLFSLEARCEGIGDLIDAIGKPKSSAEAIAQNTALIIYGAGFCGMTERLQRYKLDQSSVIQGAFEKGFGLDWDNEVKRINKETDYWWYRRQSSEQDRRQLCRLVAASLAALGY